MELSKVIFPDSEVAIKCHVGKKKKEEILIPDVLGPCGIELILSGLIHHPASTVCQVMHQIRAAKMFCPAIRCFDWKIEVSDHLHFYEGFNEISVNRLYKIVDILSYFAYPSAYSAGSANVNFGNPS